MTSQSERRGFIKNTATENTEKVVRNKLAGTEYHGWYTRGIPDSSVEDSTRSFLCYLQYVKILGTASTGLTRILESLPSVLQSKILTNKYQTLSPLVNVT